VDVREELEALLERLQTTKSIEELQVWTHELRDYFAVTHVLYHTVNQKGEQFGTFTYSNEWALRYEEKGYAAIDPVVLGSFRRQHPTDWKMLDWSSQQARALKKDSMDHGLGNQGWSVPIWGPQGEFALFVLNHMADDEAWGAFTRSRAKDILLVSHLVHQQAMRIINREMPPAAPDLSPREKETLKLLSLGHSRAQVANELKISENTLRAYIDSARHKLGALNTTHAVAQAMARGVISP
jgi:DNA-binding CsgD family transcriptional regulator